MRRATMLIIPSEWYEGFPVTLLEAFATGLPALVSRIGSLAALVKEEKTGLQFESGDASELASKVRILFANPELLQQMRQACREEYEKKYTAEINYAILEKVYSTALERQCELSGPFRQHQVSPVKSERIGKAKVVVSAFRST